MDKREAAKEWFKIAESDLSSAAFLQEMRPTPVEIICYHCQQSAEKYLKGFLSLKEEEIQKTHDLVLLSSMSPKNFKVKWILSGLVQLMRSLCFFSSSCKSAIFSRTDSEISIAINERILDCEVISWLLPKHNPLFFEHFLKLFSYQTHLYPLGKGILH